MMDMFFLGGRHFILMFIPFKRGQLWLNIMEIPVLYNRHVLSSCSRHLRNRQHQQSSWRKSHLAAVWPRPFAHSECLRAMGDAPAAMRDSSHCRTEEKRQGKCEREMRQTDTGREKREGVISLSPCLSFPSSLIFACVIPVLAVGWDLEAQMSA